jgi:hypothetical protein
MMNSVSNFNVQCESKLLIKNLNINTMKKKLRPNSFFIFFVDFKQCKHENFNPKCNFH